MKRLSHIAVILAVIIFVGYRFFIIHEMWKERNVPQEPDDAYAYMALVRRFLDFGLSTEVPGTKYLSQNSGIVRCEYLTWTAGTALFKVLTGLTMERAFYYSFYVGLILGALAFAYCLSKLEGKLFAAVGLLTLMMFLGHGAYHGFFWIVPTYYMLILYFLIITTLLAGKHWKLSLAVLVPAFVFIHGLAPFCLAALPVVFVVMCAFRRRIDWSLAKRVGFALLIAGACLVLYWTLRSSDLVPPMLTDLSRVKWLQSNRVKGVAKVLIFNKQAIDDMRTLYLAPILSEASIGIPFAFGLFWLILDRKAQLLSLWIATATLVAAACVSNYASRLLVLLWPVTYVVIGYGLYKIVSMFTGEARGSVRDVIRSLKLRKNTASIVTTMALATLMVTAAPFYIMFFSSTAKNNIEYSRYRQPLKDFTWDRRGAEQLLDRSTTGSLMVYSGKVEQTAFLAHGLWARNGIRFGLGDLREDLEGTDPTEVFLVSRKGFPSGWAYGPQGVVLQKGDRFEYSLATPHPGIYFLTLGGVISGTSKDDQKEFGWFDLFLNETFAFRIGKGSGQSSYHVNDDLTISIITSPDEKEQHITLLGGSTKPAYIRGPITVEYLGEFESPSRTEDGIDPSKDGLDRWSGGAKPLPEGWQLSGLGAVRMERSPENVRVGRVSVRLQADRDWFQLYHDHIVQPSSAYTFNLWFKGSQGQVIIEGSKSGKLHTSPKLRSRPWVHHTASFVTGPEDETVRIRLYAVRKGNTVWYDGAELRQGQGKDLLTPNVGMPEVSAGLPDGRGLIALRNLIGWDEIETWAGGGTGPPDDWSYPGGGDVVAESAEDKVRVGDNSAKLTAHKNWTMIYRTIRVIPSTTYRFGVWYNGHTGLVAIAGDKSGKLLESKKLSSQSWKYYHDVFTTGPEDNLAQVNLYLAYKPGPIWYDGAQTSLVTDHFDLMHADSEQVFTEHAASYVRAGRSISPRLGVSDWRVWTLLNKVGGDDASARLVPEIDSGGFQVYRVADYGPAKPVAVE